MVNVTINGRKTSVQQGTTIMNAAKAIGIEIPHICYWEGLNDIGACRICVVELEGKDKLVSSCNTEVEEGMVIYTNSPKVRQARKINVQLVLAEHDCKCATCPRSGNCALQTIARDLGVVGTSFVDKPIYSLPCGHVSEFESIGLGGLYISGLDEAIIVSMGTGTSIVYAKKGQPTEYLGGTGVGGGTLQGLSKLLLGMDNTAHIHELAETGNLSQIDLRVSDISRQGSFPEMKTDLTAANFGKVSDIAQKQDIAAGIFNIVFETIGMISIFAARCKGTKDIVLTGNMASFALCQKTFDGTFRSFGMDFIIPEHACFATVIGAALQA